MGGTGIKIRKQSEHRSFLIQWPWIILIEVERELARALLNSSSMTDENNCLIIGQLFHQHISRCRPCAILPGSVLLRLPKDLWPSEPGCGRAAAVQAAKRLAARTPPPFPACRLTGGRPWPTLPTAPDSTGHRAQAPAPASARPPGSACQHDRQQLFSMSPAWCQRPR